MSAMPNFRSVKGRVGSAVVIGALVGSLAGSWTAAGWAAEPAADFYKGKTVNLVIGYPPGSGYDVHARALAHHIGRHIPGQPTIVPQNMPGAGSLKATNHIYNVAPKDGTVLGAINRSLAMAPLLETEPEMKKQLRFDPLKFNWIVICVCACVSERVVCPTSSPSPPPV